MKVEIKNRLQHMIERDREQCISDIVVCGQVHIQATLNGANGSRRIVGVFSSNSDFTQVQADKQKFANYVHARSLLMRADSLTFRAEVWSAPDTENDDRPSAHPERVEQVAIRAETHDGNASAYFNVVRDADGLFEGLKLESLSFLDHPDHTGGIFAHLLAPRELHDDPLVRAECRRTVEELKMPQSLEVFAPQLMPTKGSGSGASSTVERRALPTSSTHSLDFHQGLATFQFELFRPEPGCAPAWLMAPAELEAFHVRLVDQLEYAVGALHLHALELMRRSDVRRAEFQSGGLAHEINESWGGGVTVTFDFARALPLRSPFGGTMEAIALRRKSDVEIEGDWERVKYAFRANAAGVYALLGAIWRRGGYQSLSPANEIRLHPDEREALAQSRKDLAA